MAGSPLSSGSRRHFRYVPVIAAGMLIFLGLVLLGGLSGLLWFSYTFTWWIPLDPSLLGPTADWIVWGGCFVLTILPSLFAVARKRTKLNPVVLLTSLILPLLSLGIMGWSYSVGGTLLVGCGFLAAYTLLSRSRTFLDLETDYATRVLCAEIFGFLAVVAAGGCIAALLYRVGVFVFLRSVGGQATLMDGWWGMSGIDLEVFYLGRPFLSAIFIIMTAAAFVTLFKEPIQSATRLLLARLIKRRLRVEGSVPAAPAPQTGRWVVFQRYSPYLILVASVALGVGITLYPYLVVNVRGPVGSDSWFYLQKLQLMKRPAEAFRETDRAFVLLVLFLVRAVTGLSTEWVVELMPAISSALLALSTFALVKEGTGRSWVASLAALLSVVSAQTSLGMGAGITANWFALSVANFAYAFIIRSVRRHSLVAFVGSLAVLLVLLASYAYLWVVVLAVQVLVVFATFIQFRAADRREWKYEVGILSGVLVGTVVVPIAFLLLAASPLIGFKPAGLNPNLWFTQGWNLLTASLTPRALSLSLLALEQAFVFAGNRADLPFLTLLSLIGLLDMAYRTRSFRRITAAAVLIPAVLTLMTPYMYSTWRGIYVIPLYLTGALGAESIIRRVNGQESTWSSRSRLAFALTFGAYVFLSQLSYSLRALQLLMAVVV